MTNKEALALHSYTIVTVLLYLRSGSVYGDIQVLRSPLISRIQIHKYYNTENLNWCERLGALTGTNTEMQNHSEPQNLRTALMLNALRP